jgi:nucleoside triphosphatase
MVEQQYPEPTVGALIFNPEGKIFLMRSHKWNDQYCIPGGHIELGERIEEAVIREVKEETGLDVYDLEYICLQEFIYDESFYEKRHFIFFDYACKTDSSEVTLNEEAESYVWVSLEEALGLSVESYTRRTLEI